MINDCLPCPVSSSVLEKPVLTEEPTDVEITFGGTVYFTCKAEGDPEPDIVWLYNKYVLNHQNTHPGYDPFSSICWRPCYCLATKSARRMNPNIKFFKTVRWWLRTHPIATWDLTSAWQRVQPAKSNRVLFTWNQPTPTTIRQKVPSITPFNKIMNWIWSTAVFFSIFMRHSQTQIHGDSWRRGRSRRFIGSLKLSSCWPSAACYYMDFQRRTCRSPKNG